LTVSTWEFSIKGGLLERHETVRLVELTLP
jgi:hypothetical protein